MLSVRGKLIAKLLDLDQSTEQVNTGENFNTNLRVEKDFVQNIVKKRRISVRIRQKEINQT